MRLSARNVFKGKVVAIDKGAVNATVKVDIGAGNIVTSMVTVESVNDLGIAVGGEVSIIIKASSVMLGA